MSYLLFSNFQATIDHPHELVTIDFILNLLWDALWHHILSSLHVSEIQIHWSRFFQLRNNNNLLSSSSLNVLPVYASLSSSFITYWKTIGCFEILTNDLTWQHTLPSPMKRLNVVGINGKSLYIEFKLFRLSFYYCIYYSKSCLIYFWNTSVQSWKSTRVYFYIPFYFYLDYD